MNLYSLKKGGIELKKIFSVFLCVILILSALSISAFANESDYTYTLENGKAVITCYNGNETTVCVPSILDGYSVFAIGQGAFKGNTKITSVTISEGICEVRDSAFENCTNLSEIVLPSTITRFGENAILNTAYYNDKSNWTIRYEKNPNPDFTIGDGQDTYPWEFIQADELEYIYLGTVLVRCHVKGIYNPKFETTVIADGAFRNETELKRSIVSVKTVTVGANAYNGCTSLSSVDIGNKNCKIYENAFDNTAFFNDENNWKGDFLCIGTRAILSKNDTIELVASDGVTEISNSTIGAKNVYIPATVKSIDINAFSGKTSVIYGYSGTFAEEFANDNGFTFVDLNSALMGDLDFDGEVTVNDYAMLHALNSYARKITKYEAKVSDLNLDGVTDGFDEIQIQILINDKNAHTKGDINGDGVIDRDDYDYLFNNINCDIVAFGENLPLRADLNNDGAVDALDVIYLDLYLNGKASL